MIVSESLVKRRLQTSQLLLLLSPCSESTKRYMNVGMPLEARCFLMSLSVPYQLKPLVA